MKFGLKELSSDLKNAQEKYKVLRQESVELRDEFKALFPAKNCPVFLGRNPDKSLTPLFWRYSSTVKGKKGLRPKVDDFWALISEMNDCDKARLVEFEANKMRINYHLSMVVYKIQRLEQFIKDLNSWESNIRRSMQ